MMRVAPLFETLNDLDNSTKTMQALLGNEWYRNHIQGVQEVMIGCAPQRAGPCCRSGREASPELRSSSRILVCRYSDSGKDAGRMAAAWGLYEVQENLVAVAKVRRAGLSVAEPQSI